VPAPRTMSLVLQTRTANADLRVREMQSATSVDFDTPWCQFWGGLLGVSALVECRMGKFLLQTSAFLWPKHQGAYIQCFLPYDIQSGQTVQQCFEHSRSTASCYPSGNLVFPLVSIVILLFKPSLLCTLDMNRHSGSEPKYAQLSVSSPAPASNEPLDKAVKNRTSLLQSLPCSLLRASDLP